MAKEQRRSGLLRREKVTEVLVAVGVVLRGEMLGMEKTAGRDE